VAEYYRILTRILRESGFEMKRQAKGDHELWWKPGHRKAYACGQELKVAGNSQRGAQEGWAAESVLNRAKEP
jgi:hypothetical protein